MINCENICDQLIEKKNFLNICAAVLSHSVMSDSLQPHGVQQARLLCPTRTLRACSNSCLLSQ